MSDTKQDLEHAAGLGRDMERALKEGGGSLQGARDLLANATREELIAIAAMLSGHSDLEARCERLSALCDRLDANADRILALHDEAMRAAAKALRDRPVEPANTHEVATVLEYLAQQFSPGGKT